MITENIEINGFYLGTRVFSWNIRHINDLKEGV
jgi:hypothetical protein